MPSAGVIIIGNEVLSGKVEEENAKFLIKQLRDLGVVLERVVFIRDDVDVIAKEVREMAPSLDHVFTTGGVGGTHDDVTFLGVAKGLGVELVMHPELLATLEGHFQERMNDAVRRMALVPDGTVLVGQDEIPYPVVSVRNVYVLPGVPQFLRAKFAVLAPKLRARPFFLKQIFVRVGEDRMAEPLGAVQSEFVDVEIGSYPRFDDADHRVRVTVESTEQARVEAASAAILERLDPDWLVRVE